MKYFENIDQEFFVGLVSMLTNCSTDDEMEKKRKELHVAIDKAFDVAKSFKEGEFNIK